MAGIPADADDNHNMKLSILFVLATSLIADGGGIVAQTTVSDIRVTVVANPLPMSTGQEQIAVLLETQRSSSPVRDARVALRAYSPQGRVQDSEATNSPGQGGWYTVRQPLPAAGTWKFEVLVERPGFRADIPVRATVSDAAGQIGAFMPLIALAPAGAILFAVNRMLRGHSARAEL